MTFLTVLGVTKILCSFRLVLKGKTGKEIPESSRLEFLEKFSANTFAEADAEDNIFVSLNRGGIVDLPLMRTLLAICQKSREPSFREVMGSFLTYASLAASRTLFATITSLSELCFTFRKFILWQKGNVILKTSCWIVVGCYKVDPCSDGLFTFWIILNMQLRHLYNLI